jgi:O-antigen/teichoic acid export membrane protein
MVESRATSRRMDDDDILVSDDESTRAQPSRALVSGGVLLVIATFAATASNYVYQVLAGRILGPSSYGLLSSLFTVIAVATISASSLQAACAKEVAGDQLVEHRKQMLQQRVWADPAVRAAMIAGLVAMMLTMATSPLIALFLNSGVLDVIALSLLFPPVSLIAVAFGRLQGLERFIAYAVLGLGLALGKLVLGIGALVLGLGVAGGILALVLVSIVGAGLGLHWSRDAGTIAVASIRRDVVRALLAIGLFTLILSADVPFARALLSSSSAGQFAAAAVIGHGVIWLPEVIALIAFPEMVKARTSAHDDRKLLMRSALFATLLCVVGIVVLFFAGDQLFGWFFGSRYPGAPNLAWKIGLATTPLAVANLLIYHHLAGRRSRFIGLISLCGLMQLVIFVGFHSSPNTLIAADAIAGIALVLVLIPWRTRRDGHEALAGPL